MSDDYLWHCAFCNRYGSAPSWPDAARAAEAHGRECDEASTSVDRADGRLVDDFRAIFTDTQGETA